MRVYVAAPFQDHELAAEVHRQLLTLGCLPTSTWVDDAKRRGGSDAPTPEEARAAIDRNDRDVEGAELVIVLARPGAGAEMFCEMTRAIGRGTPVVYVAQPTADHPARVVLSAHRPGVVLCADLAEAFGAIGERLQRSAETTDVAKTLAEAVAASKAKKWIAALVIGIAPRESEPGTDDVRIGCTDNLEEVARHLAMIIPRDGNVVAYRDGNQIGLVVADDAGAP